MRVSTRDAGVMRKPLDLLLLRSGVAVAVLAGATGVSCLLVARATGDDAAVRVPWTVARVLVAVAAARVLCGLVLQERRRRRLVSGRRDASDR